MTLTPSQERAVDVLGPIFAGHADPGTEACMVGWAGTGKTYTLGILAEIAQGIPYANGEVRAYGPGGDSASECEGKGWKVFPRVLFLAPTHKAARQIEKSMRKAGVWLDVRTIHKAVGVRPYRNEDEQKYEQDPSAELLITEHTRIVIFDELSMVSQQLLGLAREAMRGTGAMVGVGDPAQLPPPKEDRLCDLFDCPNTVELKEVVRHDGAILSLATRTRALTGGRARFERATSGGSKIVSYGSSYQWRDAAIDACVKAARIGDFDAARVLCFANRSADPLNREIHEKIYGEDAPLFMLGQPVVTHGPIVPPPEKPGSPMGFPVCQGTTELLIEGIEQRSGAFYGDELEFLPEIEWNWSSVIATPIEEQERVEFNILEPAQERQWKAHLKLIAAAARKAKSGGDKKTSSHLWSLYWYRQDQFAKVTPIWAMTIHKSQGSTFRSVYIHQDIDWTSDPLFKRSLSYVAITRAASELHVKGDR